MLHIKECRCLKQVIYETDRNSMDATFSKFCDKTWVGFCLRQTLFLRGFILNVTENSAKDFQHNPPFERLACFVWNSLKIWNNFNILTVKQIFSKTKSFFQKLDYRCLIESSEIENVTYPCKFTLLEANIKTIRMRITKWTYHKERSFTSNNFSFENLVQFKNLL